MVQNKRIYKMHHLITMVTVHNIQHKDINPIQPDSLFYTSGETFPKGTAIWFSSIQEKWRKSPNSLLVMYSR